MPFCPNTVLYQVKSEYVHHKAISGAIGVKLCATGIEKAVAGTPIMVVGPEDDEEDIKEEVKRGFGAERRRRCVGGVVCRVCDCPPPISQLLSPVFFLAPGPRLWVTVGARFPAYYTCLLLSFTRVVRFPLATTVACRRTFSLFQKYRYPLLLLLLLC